MEDFDDVPFEDDFLVEEDDPNLISCTVCGRKPRKRGEDLEDGIPLGWESLETGQRCPECIENAKEFEKRQKEEGAESGTSFSAAAESVARVAGVDRELDPHERKVINQAVLGTVAATKHKPLQPKRGYRSKDAKKVKVKIAKDAKERRARGRKK